MRLVYWLQTLWHRLRGTVTAYDHPDGPTFVVIGRPIELRSGDKKLPSRRL